jgi:mRNA interferase RelE/StbE
MYAVVTTKSFDKAISKLPANWQKRIVAKIREVAADPYAPNNNLAKLQGREAYRLRVGGWRVIYEVHDGCLTILVLDVGPRGGIY